MSSMLQMCYTYLCRPCPAQGFLDEIHPWLPFPALQPAPGLAVSAWKKGWLASCPEKAAFYNSYTGTVCADVVLPIAGDMVSWNRGQIQIFYKNNFIEIQFICPIIPPF